MTTNEMNGKDFFFHTLSKCAKFIRRNISKKLGWKIQNIIDDLWYYSYQ